MLNIVALGASSAIVQATLRLYAKDKASFFLVSRSDDKNELIKKDLLSRGATKVVAFGGDLSEKSCAEKLVRDAQHQLGEVDILLIGYGTLPNQKDLEEDLTKMEQALIDNFVGVARHIMVWSNYFEKRKQGHIVAISSVAGDRGRKSNYVYGSAKAGLSELLSGVRNRLSSLNIGVLTVKPGFVDTPMTKDIKKGLLFVTPEKVAQDIYNGVKSKKDVLYTPWFWRFIMLVIKVIPESVFKRLSI